MELADGSAVLAAGKCCSVAGLALGGHQTLDLGGRRIGRWPMMWVGSAAGEVRDLGKKHYCRVCRWVAWVCLRRRQAAAVGAR
ncbi:hypothetical protein ACLOJK_004565 [Asimina triloba]